MKKLLKQTIICIMISLIIQIGGLYYLNNNFLASNNTVKSQKVVDSSTSNKDSISKAKIPPNAKTINVSYDASYISYYLNDDLYVVNTITGKSVNVSHSNGVKISYYKWLPDRNRMLICETKNSNLSLSYYDVTQSKASKISNILMANSKTKVKNIETSPLTNVIYIKVRNGYKDDSIYWVNIMKTTKKVITSSQYLGNIKVVPDEDKMLYEDLSNNMVHVTGVDHALSFSGSEKSCLLGIDNNDQAYIGDVDSNNNIDKIHFGKLKGNWQSLTLHTPVSKAHLIVTASGKVYSNDSIKGTVTELHTNRKTTYKGAFLQLYSNGIASLSDGNLVKTTLN